MPKSGCIQEKYLKDDLGRTDRRINQGAAAAYDSTEVLRIYFILMSSTKYQTAQNINIWNTATQSTVKRLTAIKNLSWLENKWCLFTKSGITLAKFECS